ncbi:MAG: hypothetical protein OEW82_08095 [Dehalococcoidia bacterium]|nr:hypothetical protein [Dehalococcoidia bacterium]
MEKDIKRRDGEWQSWTRVIIGILVFGSIWGLLEATLGGFLNMIIFPNKGAIMGGIGMAIMGAALAIYRKPAMLPGIGIVAASFKWLNSWLLFIPASAIHIINPAMAIFLESLAFSLVVTFLMYRMNKNVYVGAWAAFLAGLISVTAYGYFSIYIMHAPLFERMGVSSVPEFIASHGVIQAVFFGMLAPLGYLIGKKLATTSPVFLRRPLYYYATSAAIICVCLVISAVAVQAGL